MDGGNGGGRRAADEHDITPAQALRYATAMCERAGSETPRLDGEVLLRHVLGIDRAALFARLNDPVPPDAAAAFLTLLGRRVAGEPVAYLTGFKEFMGLGFAVGPGVLIPRPETELLVEWALGWLERESGDGAVLDIGTGSGAIALSLAAALPAGTYGTIVAADASPAALRFARRNRAALALDRRVALVRGDLATWCAAGAAGLVLANLPYLTPEQLAGNPWLAAEPAEALVSGADGLDLVRRLVADLPRLLTPGAAAGLEIDPAQAASVVALLSQALPAARVRVINDLAGLARHVVAEQDVGG
jgi:release factor glutamine methyltransferase